MPVPLNRFGRHAHALYELAFALFTVFTTLACAAYGNLCPDTRWPWAKQIPQPNNDGEIG